MIPGVQSAGWQGKLRDQGSQDVLHQGEHGQVRQRAGSAQAEANSQPDQADPGKRVRGRSGDQARVSAAEDEADDSGGQHQHHPGDHAQQEPAGREILTPHRKCSLNHFEPNALKP